MALEAVGQLLVVEVHHVQDCRLKVVDAVFDEVVAEVVGLPDRDAALDATTREPDGIASRVMVAAVAAVLQWSGPWLNVVRPNSPPR